MDFKKVSLVLSAFVFMLLALNLASALNLNISSPVLSGTASNAVSGILNLTNINLADNVTSLNLTSADGLIFSLNNLAIPANSTNKTTITYNIPSGTSVGNYTKNFTASGMLSNSTSFSETGSVIVQVTAAAVVVANSTFCKNGTQGSLTVDDINVNNLGEGKDDTWQPLDKIEIEVKLRNSNSSSISSVYTELIIKDLNGNDVTDDFDVTDTELSVGSISHDSTKTVTFTINSLPTNIDAKEYNVYARVYKSGSEQTQCNFDHVQISVEKKYDQGVILKQNDINTTELFCGESNTLSFDVYNVGTDKEKNVLVNIYNSELKIDQNYLISNFNDGKRETAMFNFQLPATLTKTKYNFKVTTYFDYDTGDVYEPSSYNQNSADDLDEDFIIPTIVSNCQASSQMPAITANLTSTAQVGDNLVIQASIKNLGTADTSYIVAPSSYESWAELVSVQPQTALIAAGQSQPFAITLKPTKSGTQTFAIEARTATGLSISQSVQVTVAAKPSIFSGLSDSLGSTGTFLLVAVVILVILIVVVIIIKLASRPAKQEF